MAKSALQGWGRSSQPEQERVSQKHTNLIQYSSLLSMKSLLGRLNKTGGLLTILNGPVMNWRVQPIMGEI